MIRWVGMGTSWRSYDAASVRAGCGPARATAGTTSPTAGCWTPSARSALPPHPFEAVARDPSPLKGPLYKLLGQLWKGRRDEYEGWDKRLAVSLEAQPIVTFQDGRGSDPKVIDGSQSLEC
jgi:hypothetical protein